MELKSSPFRDNFPIHFPIFLCLVSLMGSVFFEHYLQVSPCDLCLYQRWLWMGLLAVSMFRYFWERRPGTSLVQLGVAFSIAAVSTYHSFVQFGWIESRCSNTIAISSHQDFLQMLKADTVSCVDLSATAFGVPLPIISLLLVLALITSLSIPRFRSAEEPAATR
jgi:disulfide bond formation protein DsbB